MESVSGDVPVDTSKFKSWPLLRPDELAGLPTQVLRASVADLDNICRQSSGGDPIADYARRQRERISAILSERAALSRVKKLLEGTEFVGRNSLPDGLVSLFTGSTGAEIAPSNTNAQCIHPAHQTGSAGRSPNDTANANGSIFTAGSGADKEFEEALVEQSMRSPPRLQTPRISPPAICTLPANASDAAAAAAGNTIAAPKTAALKTDAPNKMNDRSFLSSCSSHDQGHERNDIFARTGGARIEDHTDDQGQHGNTQVASERCGQGRVSPRTGSRSQADELFYESKDDGNTIPHAAGAVGGGAEDITPGGKQEPSGARVVSDRTSGAAPHSDTALRRYDHRVGIRPSSQDRAVRENWGSVFVVGGGRRRPRRPPQKQQSNEAEETPAARKAQVDKERLERRKASLRRLMARKQQRALQQEARRKRRAVSSQAGPAAAAAKEAGVAARAAIAPTTALAAATTSTSATATGSTAPKAVAEKQELGEVAALGGRRAGEKHSDLPGGGDGEPQAGSQRTKLAEMVVAGREISVEPPELKTIERQEQTRAGSDRASSAGSSADPTATHDVLRKTVSSIAGIEEDEGTTSFVDTLTSIHAEQYHTDGGGGGAGNHIETNGSGCSSDSESVSGGDSNDDDDLFMDEDLDNGARATRGPREIGNDRGESDDQAARRSAVEGQDTVVLREALPAKRSGRGRIGCEQGTANDDINSRNRHPRVRARGLKVDTAGWMQGPGVTHGRQEATESNSREESGAKAAVEIAAISLRYAPPEVAVSVHSAAQAAPAGAAVSPANIGAVGDAGIPSTANEIVSTDGEEMNTAGAPSDNSDSDLEWGEENDDDGKYLNPAAGESGGDGALHLPGPLDVQPVIKVQAEQESPVAGTGGGGSNISSSRGGSAVGMPAGPQRLSDLAVFESAQRRRALGRVPAGLGAAATAWGAHGSNGQIDFRSAASAPTSSSPRLPVPLPARGSVSRVSPTKDVGSDKARGVVESAWDLPRQQSRAASPDTGCVEAGTGPAKVLVSRAGCDTDARLKAAPTACSSDPGPTPPTPELSSVLLYDSQEADGDIHNETDGDIDEQASCPSNESTSTMFGTHIKHSARGTGRTATGVDSFAIVNINDSRSVTAADPAPSPRQAFIAAARQGRKRRIRSPATGAGRTSDGLHGGSKTRGSRPDGATPRGSGHSTSARYADCFPAFAAILAAYHNGRALTRQADCRSLPLTSKIMSRERGSSGAADRRGGRWGGGAGLTAAEEEACLRFQWRLYAIHIRVIKDYATVFSYGDEWTAGFSGGDQNSLVYSGESSALHYRVNSKARPEVYNIVTDVLNNRCEQWEELPTGLGLKTTWNLLWTWSKPHIRYSSLLTWQKVNHFPNSRELTRKDLLNKHISRFMAPGGRLAREFHIMPQTFVLPHEFTLFVAAFTASGRSRRAGRCSSTAEGYHDVNNDVLSTDDEESRCGTERIRGSGSGGSRCGRKKNWWIMKPVGMSRGRGIRLIDDIKNISYADKVVLQRYIGNPLLLDGYKFDLRLYVLVTSFNKLEAFIYKEGFARLSTHRYEKGDIDNRFVHLTNSSIQRLNEAGASRDSPLHHATIAEAGGTKTTLSYLWRRLAASGVDVGGLWAGICSLIVKSLVCVEGAIPNQPNSFELFGYDVLIDDRLRPWLIEVNSSPSMARDTHVDRQVKEALIFETIHLVDPLPFDRKKLVDVLGRRLSENESLKSKPFKQQHHHQQANQRQQYGYAPESGVNAREGGIKTNQSSAGPPSPSTRAPEIGGQQQPRRSKEEAELDRDLGDILCGRRPRRVGELPARMGNFVRLCPGTAAHRHARRLRRRVIRPQPGDEDAPAAAKA